MQGLRDRRRSTKGRRVAFRIPTETIILAIRACRKLCSLKSTPRVPRGDGYSRFLPACDFVHKTASGTEAEGKARAFSG